MKLHEGKLKRLSVGIPFPVYNAVKRLAREKQMHMSDVIREAVETYVGPTPVGGPIDSTQSVENTTED